MYRPYHLIGLELGVSVASAALRNEPTESPQAFLADVASVAKKDLAAGDALDGEGGFTVYGWLVRAAESLSKGYLPIGLTAGALLKRPVASGSILTYEDVGIDRSSFAYRLRQTVEGEAR